MDASTSVQLSRFEQPEIVPCKVTEWHGVPEQVFLKTFSLFFILNVLLYESSLVVVEMLENELFVKWVFLGAHLKLCVRVCSLLRVVFFNLYVVLYYFLLYVFQCIV